jgi:hypothetical protein
MEIQKVTYLDCILRGRSILHIKTLQEDMEAVIPYLEDDMVVLYASVEGKDRQGVLRRREISKKILPQKVGKHV